MKSEIAEDRRSRSFLKAVSGAAKPLLSDKRLLNCAALSAEVSTALSSGDFKPASAAMSAWIETNLAPKAANVVARLPACRQNPRFLN